MSYTVLARKYRSRDFDELVGQDHVSQTLRRAIESGRVAHAFLFCGTRGTGKTSTARILAKCLNCEAFDKPTTTPCGKCNSCLGIARGDDIDVLEIDAASNTQVEKTRDLIDNAQYHPARSRFKVYIIDEVHMLSKASFNALLKTMEEPPSHVKFILATTEPEKVLATILSRVQRYDFRAIPAKQVAEHLKEVCKKEKIKADDDALLLVAKAGGEPMRDALSLLDRLLSVGEKELTVEGVEQLLGMPKTQAILDLVDSMGNGDVKATLERADVLIKGGLNVDTLLASLVDHFRNLLILRACGRASDLVEVPGLDLDTLVEQAGRFDAAAVTQNIAIIEELRRHLRTSIAGRSLLDATLVRLALAEQFVSIEEVLDGTPSTGSVKKKYELSAPTIAAPLTPAEIPDGEADVAHSKPEVETSSSTESDSDDALPAVGKVWDDGPKRSLASMFAANRTAPKVVPAAPPESATRREESLVPVDTSDLNAIVSRLRTMLDGAAIFDAVFSNGRLTAISDNIATMTFPAEADTYAAMLDRNGRKDTLAAALSKLLGRDTGIRIQIAEAEEVDVATPAPVEKRPSRRDEPADADAAPPAAMPIRITPELREQLKADPLVAAVMTELGGDIIGVE